MNWCQYKCQVLTLHACLCPFLPSVSVCSCRSKWGTRSACLPLQPKIFSSSCSFSEILTKSYVGAPFYGEFWIHPRHAPTDALHMCSCLCIHLHPIFPFAPISALCSHLCPFCLCLLCLHTHSSSYIIILSLYIKCQYLDQPAHYSKYLDKFLAVLLTAFTTGTHFCKIIKTRGNNPMF